MCDLSFCFPSSKASLPGWPGMAPWAAFLYTTRGWAPRHHRSCSWAKSDPCGLETWPVRNASFVSRHGTPLGVYRLGSLSPSPFTRAPPERRTAAEQLTSGNDGDVEQVEDHKALIHLKFGSTVFKSTRLDTRSQQHELRKDFDHTYTHRNTSKLFTK